MHFCTTGWHNCKISDRYGQWMPVTLVEEKEGNIKIFRVYETCRIQNHWREIEVTWIVGEIKSYQCWDI